MGKTRLVDLGSCFPTLPQKKTEGWGTRLLCLVMVTKSNRRSFDFAQDDKYRGGPAIRMHRRTGSGVLARLAHAGLTGVELA
jgi:hypothetical protein